MKKIIVSSAQKNTVPEKFQPEWFANKLLLESEFRDGKEAYIKFSRGKLTILVGKKPKHFID